jgi:hypothetical protein
MPRAARLRTQDRPRVAPGASRSTPPTSTISAALTNEGNSQEPQRSGWTLLHLSVCGTHAVGLRAAETCIRVATQLDRGSSRVAVCAGGAFDGSERSTAKLGSPGASQEPGGCKHQSSSHPAGGRAAGIGRSRQRRTLRRHGPFGLRAVAGAASRPSLAGHGMSPKRSVVRARW